MKRFLVSCAAIAFSTAAPAQMVQAVPGAVAGDPADTLSMHLRTLAARPRDLSALLGAGEAALDVGDPNAALGFFARAEEIDARNGRAKAGLASALVQLEKPDDALRLFGEAVSLGVPEATIAKDRGLAYDLRGDNRRAQRDYVTALKRAPDDEVTRRYALSLGISGDRNQAMTLLDPLLRKQDQAAWRARAFILAMTGDVSGANAIARQVMPGGLSATMSPFLTRLAKLNAAERAHAVNFGTIPADGQTMASVQMGDPFKPVETPAASRAGDGLIPAGDPLGPRPSDVKPTRVAEAPSREPRRIPGRDPASAPQQTAVAAPPPPTATPGFSAAVTRPPAASDPAEPTRLGARVGARIGPVDRSLLPPEARGDPGVTSVRIAATALPAPDDSRAPALAAPTPPVATPPSVIVAPPPVQTAATDQPARPSVAETALPPSQIGPPVADDDKPFEIPAREPLPNDSAPVAVAAADPAPAAVITTPKPTVVAAAPVSRLASILDGIQPEAESAATLPTASEIRAAQRAAARKAQAQAEADAAAKKKKEEEAAAAAKARANPARLWVQVATGSNEAGLSTTWKRIREGNAAALKGLSGYSVPFKATNRVLAGPVKSAAEARRIVNDLAKSGVSATTYSSEAGQEVLKLAGK